MSFSKTGSSMVMCVLSGLLISSFLPQMLFYNNIFAHDFAPNESAQFLALMQLLETEINLVNYNFINNNSNLAEDHAIAAIGALTPAVLREITERNERVANDLNTSLNDLHEFVLTNKNNTISNTSLDSRIGEISAIIGETVSVRIDPDQINNATIQALSFANMIDIILKSYGDAYDVDFDITNMSQMAGMGMHMGNDSSGMGMHMGANGPYNEIVNATGYQTAQALSERAVDIFKTELKPLAEGVDKISMTSNLENALIELLDSIENKAPPMDVMMIVHAKVHPNILTIFDLALVS